MLSNALRLIAEMSVRSSLYARDGNRCGWELGGRGDEWEGRDEKGEEGIGGEKGEMGGKGGLVGRKGRWAGRGDEKGEGGDWWGGRGDGWMGGGWEKSGMWEWERGVRGGESRESDECIDVHRNKY